MSIGPKGSKLEIGFKKFIFFLLWVGRLIGGKVSKLENDLKEPGNCQSFQNPINVMVKLTYGHFHSLQDVEREKVTTIE